MRLFLTAAMFTAVLLLTFISGHTDSFAKKLPEVEVRMHMGRPTVFIDGEPNALSGYSPGQSRAFYDNYMPLFYKHGISVYLIWIGPGIAGNRFWEGDTISEIPFPAKSSDPFDLDEQVEHILKGDPNAYIIVRFYTRAPESWKILHPEEYFINEEGKVQTTPSRASDAFWEKATRLSAAIIKYCESQSWGNRVIGYNTHYLEEGGHLPVGDGWLFDHSPSMIRRWKEFLRKKYVSVEKLRKAHNDTTLTFENVRVPKDKLRRSVSEVTNMLYWQNRMDNQVLRDYLELTRDVWHLRYRQTGQAMQDAVKRKVLFLNDANKQTMLGWNLKGFFGYSSFGEKISWSPAFPGLITGSGHINVAELLDNSPGYSGLLTPHDYQARGVGGVFEPEGITDAVILRGDMFYAEMDTRSGDHGIGAARDDREWAAITWRNYATAWTRGFHTYWMYGFQIADWFGTEPIQKTIGRQVEVINESLTWQHENVPGIAMILDDSAVFETNGSGNYFNEAIIWEWKQGMARCGVPFRIHLFEDLALDNFPKHRVYYFPNLFRVDDERLEILKNKVFRDGNIVIWGPGSGISDGEKIGTESASRLTGFQFTMLPANAPRRILISNFDHPITKNLDEAMVVGGPLPYGPVLLPTDGTELGLAWAKGGMNHFGMSLKEFGKGAAQNKKGIASRSEGDYAAIFMTAVQIPADLWRNIARYAGAHVYSESNDVLLADKSIVALHSLKSGKKTIKLPEMSRVKDLVTGKDISKEVREINFILNAPETKVFLLEK